ncbi:MAG: YjgP/YjgQ family permease [Bacteroidales bacterium]|nr:YjgP/YjgQ family permease [Bacteroidales bacterium]MDE7466404.1 LptF/LptG family permease [Muribaculaceae bacterium]
MRIIKRLYGFILKSFLPLFAMTFFIVLFIVLMQFLWKYIDDLVGKGLSMDVLAELFFYAAVSMVPMALPLAILLASLMTFGNLGEKSELTAIKASGVSLLQVMKPLIILITFIAVGAFFFQNDVLPKAQVKMWTLLFSMKQKSPEVEIPEGVFYDQIPGYNLYVKSKNRETGMLHDVMIYDLSKGGDNATILLADSARLAFTEDSRYLYLHLFKGEQFENLREQRALDKNVPFRRESFYDKEVLIPFDANFNRLDEGGMRKQYVGKNIKELRQTIDSVSLRVDSIGAQYTAELIKSRALLNTNPNYDSHREQTKPRELPPLNMDSIWTALGAAEMANIFRVARNQNEIQKNDNQFRAAVMRDENKTIRRHEIELIKKFTLSVACLIFFFIGAPLGAIIRKGGLGTPLVISVLLFLVYYIIDNTGYKMARDGHIAVWIGMWLSTAILLPLGIYVTIKAMNDSAVFNKDLYQQLFRKIFGIRETRHVPLKEVIIRDVNPNVARGKLAVLYGSVCVWERRHRQVMSYARYWKQGFDIKGILSISDKMERVVEYMADSRDVKVIHQLNQFPVLKRLWIYRPASKRWLRLGLMWFAPVGLPIYLVALTYGRRLRQDMKRIEETSIKTMEVLRDQK